jgi:hypothetical protein
MTEHYDNKKRLKVIIASVGMLSVVMQNVITTYVRELNVVAPLNTHEKVTLSKNTIFGFNRLHFKTSNLRRSKLVRLPMLVTHARVQYL